MHYYAGIDMAARTSHVCIIDDSQSVLVDEKIPNDLDAVYDIFRRFRRKIEVVVEASFNWYWLVDALSDWGVRIRMAHPALVRAITTAKVKTDRRDARCLAELLRANLIPESHICPHEQRRLRDLCRLRWRNSEASGGVLRRLRQILANEGYHTVSTDTLRDLDLDSLDVDPRVLTAIRMQQRIMATHQSIVADLDEELARGIEAIPDFAHGYQLLRAIPGFGPVNAATVLLESGDLTRFQTVNHYCSFARLAPGLSQSGESKNTSRKSKAGNEHLKRAFTSAAMNASKGSAAIRAFRDKHRARRSSQSACHLLVNSIVAHKLAKGVFIMLTRNEPWNEEKLFCN